MHAVTRRERPSLGNRIDGEHLRAEMDADTRGELTDRAEPVDGQRVSRAHSGVAYALPCGGEDVAQEQVAVVGQL